MVIADSVIIDFISLTFVCSLMFFDAMIAGGGVADWW
jgi:hypothetical protein